MKALIAPGHSEAKAFKVTRVWEVAVKGSHTSKKCTRRMPLEGMRCLRRNRCQIVVHILFVAGDFALAAFFFDDMGSKCCSLNFVFCLKFLAGDAKYPAFSVTLISSGVDAT